MAAIRLSGVSKLFGSNYGLQNIDLAIADHEFLVLVGPSGCGKSTLLRLIAGLEQLSSGEIYLGDRQIDHLPPKNRDLAMVFQNYALYPHLTVFDNIAFGLRRQQAKTDKQAIAQQVLEVAKCLQIEMLLQRKPAQLSGGQKQRVALGRAIARQPQAFLMDEPLSNLDAKLRGETRTQIVQLQKQLRTTTIYVTHDQTEAMTMGDRIVVLREGKIQQIDTPLQLYNQPHNRFVAEFIGTPAMNFLPVTLDSDRNLQSAHFIQSLSLDSLTLGSERKIQSENPLDIQLEIPSGITFDLGIRPEHIHQVVNSDQADLVGEIILIETLGSETIIAIRPLNCTPGQTIKIRSFKPEFNLNRLGEKTYWQIDRTKIYLFDRINGTSIYMNYYN
jgi:multiple sugar transport system ATP-binding protein